MDGMLDVRKVFLWVAVMDVVKVDRLAVRKEVLTVENLDVEMVAWLVARLENVLVVRWVVWKQRQYVFKSIKRKYDDDKC